MKIELEVPENATVIDVIIAYRKKSQDAMEMIKRSADEASERAARALQDEKNARKKLKDSETLLAGFSDWLSANHTSNV